MDNFKRKNSAFDSFDESEEIDGSNDRNRAHTPTNAQPQWTLETHLKIGFAGKWNSAQIEIEGNILTANVDLQPDVIEETLNIKKIKKCEIVSDDARISNLAPPWPYTSIIIIEYIDKSLYIMPKGGLADCTAIRMWIEGGQSANENELEEQQLTMDDIPVIVDKCLKFITTQGCLSEGIYRIAGINNRIITLLEEFRKNAWAVRLNPSQYSEHDVANTLKRFFRTLDNSLLTKELRSLWLQSSAIDNTHHRLELYGKLLSELPRINYITLRRLLVHLRTVSEQCEHNLMPCSNLAALWGPTILTTDRMSGIHFTDCTSESKIVIDLIDNMYALFDIHEEELNKEKDLLQVLLSDQHQEHQDMELNPKHVHRPSGDIKVWIYVESKKEGENVCLVIYPKMTVMEATTRVWQQLKKDYKVTHILHEIILKEGLERPMNHKEILMDSILKWSNWPEEDRKHNYLILKAIRNEFKESLKIVNPASTFSENINYSSNAVKRLDIAPIRRNKSNFQTCLLEIKGDYAICSKRVKNKGKWLLDVPNTASIGEGLHRKSLSLMSLAAPSLVDSITCPPIVDHDITYESMSSWLLNDIFWYYGADSKRHSPNTFNITLVKKDVEISRSRTHPYFGDAISFESQNAMIEFVAALLQVDHGDNIQEKSRNHGVPMNKKPSKQHDHDVLVSPSNSNSNSDIDNLTSDTDQDEYANVFETEEYNGNPEEHRSEDASVNQLLRKLSINSAEKQSLKQLLSSLSGDKMQIQRQVTSEKFKQTILLAKPKRPSSFSF